LLVNIVENAEFSDSKLPNGQHVLELRRQAHKAFSPTRGNCWLASQVILDGIDDTALIIATQDGNFLGREFVDEDVKCHPSQLYHL